MVAGLSKSASISLFANREQVRFSSHKILQPPALVSQRACLQAMLSRSFYFKNLLSDNNFAQEQVIIIIHLLLLLFCLPRLPIRVKIERFVYSVYGSCNLVLPLKFSKPAQLFS